MLAIGPGLYYIFNFRFNKKMEKHSGAWILTWLALGLLLGRPASASSADAVYFSKPEFNERGKLVVIASPGEGRFLLQIHDPSAATGQSRLFSLGPGASLPVLKKDAYGCLWAIWTQEDGRRFKLGLSRVAEDLEAPAFLDFPGQPFLPWDFCLDADGHGWLAWVEENRSRQDVRLRNLGTAQTWTIASGVREANALRLLTDAHRSLWIFWTAVTSGQEQVFCRRLEGTAWSPEIQLSTGLDIPNITPRMAADAYGHIWLVWAGYDGQDYEILARVWDGRAWTPTVAVTENSGANDVFPSVDLAFGGIPVISWIRYTKQGNRIMVRSGKPGQWSDESELTALAGEQPFVPLAFKDDLAGLAWPDRDSLRPEWFFLPGLVKLSGGISLPLSLPPFPRHRALAPRLGPIYNPDLDENIYIAFGDSITYGVCDEDRIGDPGDYIPDKAYPPRLEAMLTQSFGPHQVVNAGVPGESTFQGLARIDTLLAEHLARYILILEGTNDIIWNDYSLTTTSFNLEQIIRKSLDYGLLPALATNIERYGWYANRPRLHALNIKIRELAVECLIPLEDLYQDFIDYPEDDGGDTSLYCWGEDRTHPNEKGYQFMAEKWFQRIKDFPFPPAQAGVRRAVDDILFFRKEGNLLEWRDNPKINDPAQIQEFRIYRKKNSEAPSAFRLLAAVAGQYSYFDSDIQPNEIYTYTVSTVIPGGIEGPGTLPLIR
jgi:lysophospholipase L1-like esterase